MSTSVQVAVRVRPFNAAIDGKESKFVCGVKMNGPSTTVFNTTNTESKTFTFDYSFWSHNPDDSHYVDNKKIFESLGQNVLDNAWNGYNVSLFAYGQTGSGKSFSMIGSKDEPGIIPQVADEIFRRITHMEQAQVSEGALPADIIHYEVKVAMMELYNEEIRDLLNPKGTVAGGLKIREDPTTGPFVQDLIFSRVKNYQEIEKVMAQGTAMRTVRQTQMNDQSSRAHTIVQIVISQKVLNTKKNDGSLRVSRESTINLIDLAGSERVKDSGVAGDGLKEAIAINTSLTYLGKVITALAEVAEGKNKNQVIPYRSSKLTFLLKNSLGGNAKTIMIAAVRPGADYFDESVSTLRYADSAKKIKNKPVVNEDPRDASIRALKEEIERLKEQLGMGGSTSTSSGADPAEIALLTSELEKSQKLIAQLQEQDKEDEERDAELARLRDLLLSKSGVTEFDRTQIPHLLNLQEDPQQTGLIAFPLQKVGVFTIGKVTPDVQPDIELSGLGIKKNHASIRLTDDNRLFVTPSEKSTVHVNGSLVSGEIEVRNNDRLIFGNTILFRVVVPSAQDFDPEDNTYDWTYAQKEYVQVHLNAISAEKQKEIEERMKQIELEAKRQEEERLKLEDEKKKVEEELAKQSEDDALIAELKRQLAEQEKAIQSKEVEISSLKSKKAQEETLLEAEQQKQDSPFQARVLELIHLVEDANEIAKKIGKNYTYEMRVVNQIDEATGETVEDLVVISKDNATGLCSIIADEDFLVRIFKMKSIYSEFKIAKDTGKEWKGVSPDDDPFFTESIDEPQVYGGFNIPFSSLYTLKPSTLSLDITTLNGGLGGAVTIEIVPCDKSGNPDGVYDYLGVDRNAVDGTNLSLVGKDLTFMLRFVKASGLNPNHCDSSFIRYALPFDSILHETQPCMGVNSEPKWKYSRMITVSVTQKIENFLKKGLLHALVYAKLSDPNLKKVGVKELRDEISLLRFELEEARSTIKQLVEEKRFEVSKKLNLERRLKTSSEPGEPETEEQRAERLRLKAEKKARKAAEKAEKKARKAAEKAEKKARKAAEKAEKKARKAAEKEAAENSAVAENVQLKQKIADLENQLAAAGKSEENNTNTNTDSTPVSSESSDQSVLLAEKDKEIESLKQRIYELEASQNQIPSQPTQKKSSVCVVS